MKLEGTKFSHILPLRFECKNDFSTNYKTLNLYPYDKFTSENNIYKFLERCVPKNINLKNTIFLIVESETKVEYFKKVFLTTEYIPKAHFVFFKPLKDMKELASLSGCYELDDFLVLYKPIYKKIRKYLSDIIPNTRTTYAASFLITPSSRTEKCTASMKTIGYTGDNGRFCHSSILGRSLSVISDTIPSLTSKP